MNDTAGRPSRRRFLSVVGAATAGAVIGGRRWARGEEVAKKRRTVLSFYCDDTGPYNAGAKAFETFLDFCAEQKIAGESSLILGGGGHCMARKPNDEEQAYLKQVARALACGIDTHMEIMTHRGLFDFEGNREREGAIHEGLWLHEPAVAAEEYERYFASILAEGEKAGVKFTGFTWPGCGCGPCTKRYAELRAKGIKDPNPAMWKALLSLAKQDKFRGRTVPCFFGSSETDFACHRKASDGECGVYDLMPNAGDRFGIWENSPRRVDPDYYITADGKAGIIVRHVGAGAPYCIWYAHWQGLNPAKGVGWKAFVTVVERIKKHLGERVVWMRPSDITARYHRAGGWGFLDSV